MPYFVTLYDEGPASYTVKGTTGKRYTFKKGEPTEVDGLDYYGLMAYKQLKFPKEEKQVRRIQPLDHRGYKGASVSMPSITKAQYGARVAQENMAVAATAAASRRALADMKRELRKSNDAETTEIPTEE